jgi:hypothetical protein
MFEKLVFVLRHKETLSVGQWAATYSEENNAFEVVLDCCKCAHKFSWLLPVGRVVDTSNVGARHCKKNDVIPNELLRRMQKFVGEKSIKPETWDDVERKGERLI